MRNGEGEWVNTPRRRRAARQYVEDGAWGPINGTEDVVVLAGDTPEVAEDVHPRETFTHDP